MLEGQLEVTSEKIEVEQTIFVYQSNHSTLPTLLGNKQVEHTCMGLSMTQEVLGRLAHLGHSMTTMHHVQFVTHQDEKQL